MQFFKVVTPLPGNIGLDITPGNLPYHSIASVIDSASAERGQLHEASFVDQY